MPQSVLKISVIGYIFLVLMGTLSPFARPICGFLQHVFGSTIESVFRIRIGWLCNDRKFQILYFPSLSRNRGPFFTDRQIRPPHGFLCICSRGSVYMMRFLNFGEYFGFFRRTKVAGNDFIKARSVIIDC